MMSSGPRTLLETHRVVLDEELMSEVEVVVRRDRRARHVRIQVEPDGEVRASIPWRFRLSELEEIVRERAAWLVTSVTAARLTAQSTRIDLHGGDPVRLLGQWHATELRSVRRRPGCRFEGERLVIATRAHDDPYDVLEKWYRQQARDTIAERVAHFAEQFGLRYGALSIRDQRTRWGSCSQEGNLNFNWRLVLAPLWVMDAIVVHELCHIDVLDHSERFWSLLEQRYPRHAEAQEWLRRHGPALSISRARRALAKPGRPVALFD